MKHLQKEKIFIIFLKDGKEIYGKEIHELIQSTPNSKFLFITNKKRIIKDKEDFYILGMDEQGKEDLGRIL